MELRLFWHERMVPSLGQHQQLRDPTNHPLAAFFPSLHPPGNIFDLFLYIRIDFTALD
jgi:hypothetical protein